MAYHLMGSTAYIQVQQTLQWHGLLAKQAPLLMVVVGLKKIKS
jgi:hypothetical protein